MSCVCWVPSIHKVATTSFWRRRNVMSWRRQNDIVVTFCVCWVFSVSCTAKYICYCIFINRCTYYNHTVYIYWVNNCYFCNKMFGLIFGIVVIVLLIAQTTQQTHNVAGTSLQRCWKVTTLQRRCCDVVCLLGTRYKYVGHMTFMQRRINVYATPGRCIDVQHQDVTSTLMRRCLNVVFPLGRVIGRRDRKR